MTMSIGILSVHKVEKVCTEHPGETVDILWAREAWGLWHEDSQHKLEQAQRHAPGYKDP
jgi:hypothetical protein